MRYPSKRSVLIAMVLMAVGTGAYAVGLATRPAAAATPAPTTAETADPAEALMDWLGVSAQQRADLRAHDPAFGNDLGSLRATLVSKRLEFAAALDDPQTSDQTIRERLEAVIAADASLERRVTDFLLLVRDHLTAVQQRRLFGVCAQQIRMGPGYGWGAGQGAGRGPGAGRGMGRGGPPWMSSPSTAPGAGPMRGRGWGGGRGLGPPTAGPASSDVAR